MFRELMIKDVAKMVNSRTTLNSLELVRGVSIHSKTTTPGDLFFALKGERTDGHRYIHEALMNGACAAVVQETTNAAYEILVNDTLFAMGQLAQKYRSSFDPRTIAITGTNGKTTVKNLVGAILTKKYSVLCSKKNYNSLIGLPLTLFALSPEKDYLVVEMGTSNPGEIARLCEITKPHIGIITNIGPGHLKGLGSIDGVRKEKLSLIEALPKDGFALVGEGIADNKEENINVFSLTMCKDIQLNEHGSYFTYNENRFFSPLLGIGNVFNCLAALCLTTHLCFEYEVQRAALADVKPESGRMEPLYCGGLFIINDTYNANPVSMKAAIDFTTTLQREKVFVLGDMLELGKQTNALHEEVGHYAKNHCDLLLTYGDTAQLYPGIHFKDKSQLTHYLVNNLNGDEVVLVKASRALHFEDIVLDLMKLWR